MAEKLKGIKLGDTTYEFSLQSSDDGAGALSSDNAQALGENSVALGNETIAYANGSIAMGTETQAGCKGYYIAAIDPANNHIYLHTSDNAVTPTWDDPSSFYDETFESGYKILGEDVSYGNEFSISADGYYHWTFAGNISEISGNRLTYVSETLNTSKKWLSNVDNGADPCIFFIPVQPGIGLTNVGLGAVAEGWNTHAAGQHSHAEGYYSIVAGRYGHAEGNSTRAGFAAHVEGVGSLAQGHTSHAEGGGTKAIGEKSHAEGDSTQAIGDNSHAEGSETVASKRCSHAEGYKTEANGVNSHAEGFSNSAEGSGSHAEGNYTTASGSSSHAEGYKATASGDYSHAENEKTGALGSGSHAEGGYTIAQGQYSHAEGGHTAAQGQYSHAEGGYKDSLTLVITGDSDATEYFLASKNSDIVAGQFIYYNGKYTKITAYNSSIPSITVESTLSDIDLDSVSVIIDRSLAYGESSHAEGYCTVASGKRSHAEGHVTIAQGDYSHAENAKTRALGKGSHAEGSYTIADGWYQHVQGMYNDNSGENYVNTSHPAYNKDNQATGKYAVIVGNGTKESKRSNAHTIDWSGNAWFAGKVSAQPGEADNDLVTIQQYKILYNTFPFKIDGVIYRAEPLMTWREWIEKEEYTLNHFILMDDSIWRVNTEPPVFICSETDKDVKLTEIINPNINYLLC